jgi:hypothetical protein
VNTAGQSVNNLRTSRKLTIQLEEEYSNSPNVSHFLREHLLFSLFISKEVAFIREFLHLHCVLTDDICFLVLH